MDESSSDSPRDRADRAARRAAEARQRSQELAAGELPTEEDVEAAETALDDAHDRAGIAARHAAATLRRSADRHSAVADVLEAAGRSERAEDHRRAAAQDVREARKDDTHAEVEEGGDSGTEPEP